MGYYSMRVQREELLDKREKALAEAEEEHNAAKNTGGRKSVAKNDRQFSNSGWNKVVR